VCSLASVPPACVRMKEEGSLDHWSVVPMTPDVPQAAGRLSALLEREALDADGVWWRADGKDWKAVSDTRGTTKFDGGEEMVCGATPAGVWCSDVGETLKKFDVGTVVDLAVEGNTAAFELANGHVGLIDGSDYKPLTLEWSSALEGTKSLTVLQQRLACGLNEHGKIVCVTFAAPDRSLSLGNEGKSLDDVGCEDASLKKMKFVALRAANGGLPGMYALATDGNILALRPPDPVCHVFAVDGVALIGEDNLCVVRRTGPWLCDH
jgi:hypothetical protein